MNYMLNNEKIEKLNDTDKTIFPKYTSQLINLANQNAQGTRPVVVGQMSELFMDFLSSDEEKTVDGWRKWYTNRQPNALANAYEKIYLQLNNLKQAISCIDEKMVKDWVWDLLINKTFNGLYVQKAILASLAEIKCMAYRLATPEEEAVGIDGYIGDTAYSIKPITYQETMGRLPENINVKMIYYTKTKHGLKIEVDD